MDENDVGTRWVQVRTGRVIKIVQAEVHGTGPGCVYEDTGEWFYCDVADFYIWKQYIPVAQAKA